VPSERETFFTPEEWKATLLFRPLAWRAWWAALTSKLLAILVALLLCSSALAFLLGSKDTSALLLTLFGVLFGLVVLFAIGAVLVASVRWVLSKLGVVSLWRRSRKQLAAAAKVVLWISVIVWILSGLWPYLSLDPVKSWYALNSLVPVARVEVEKRPHDCEFLTAPLGEKHCHYNAKAFVLSGADTPDGRKSLVVGYERVND
jgi:hypothetical protein